jgi:DNA mismatch repair ATPase MutS
LIFEKISTQHGEISHYQATFELLYSLPGEGEKIVEIRDRTVRAAGGINQQLGYVGWVIMLANIRHNPLFFFAVYVPLQLTVLWDFHILDLLERWQAKHGKKVRTWFDTLGEVEALNCLAALAHDYYDWIWPTIDDTADRLTAKTLGHPLISDEARVANDVEVGPAGTVLLVTGSNMSGKSTLLRSLGVNIALAQAGGPVCATSLSLPPLDVATSMRIGDSLAEGVSFYMAELKRLKQIVDASRQQAIRGRKMFYLLDEILQGTNSRERHIAVVQVLAHLISANAIGAISTHDLDLATSDSIAKHCRAVHFREHLHGGDSPSAMTFDYIMREGVATTTNALKLLELVGLSDKSSS